MKKYFNIKDLQPARVVKIKFMARYYGLIKHHLKKRKEVEYVSARKN